MAKRKPRKRSTHKPEKVKTPAPEIAEAPAPLAATLPRVEGELTNCPKCKSTDRTRYHKTRAPLVWNGGTTTWNRTQCKKCGQYRVDRHTHRH